MSGMVFDDESVIVFTPIPVGLVYTWTDGSGGTFTDGVLGFGIVVTHRDGWVVETECVPMAFCCGSVLDIGRHSMDEHGRNVSANVEAETKLIGDDT